jgi:3-oxoacyl-[acyl-carrier protein] reductase
MEISFTGKKVIVASGSRGIGLAIAGAFASNGADVVICARRAQGLKTAAGSLGL